MKPRIDALLVGEGFCLNSQTLVEKLSKWGFRCRFANNVEAALQLSRSYPVDVVLSDVHLSDGTAFDLIEALEGLPVTAFLCLRVEDDCFWLPALDRGTTTWGSPALRPMEFTHALKELTGNGGNRVTASVKITNFREF